MVKAARAAVVPVVLVALIALSGLVLGRIYADGLLAQLVAGAALGSVGVSVAARRLPSWSVAPLSVLLLAGYTLFALHLAAGRADVTAPLPRIVADSLTNGIPRLLTAMIPVEATPDTVVVPMVAAWLAGLAGAELAVRTGRVLLGCAPAAALYAGALYVVGPNAAAAGWPTVAFAGLVVLALAITANQSDGTALSEVPATTRAAVRGRALVSAAAGLVLLAGLIAVVGPWVSDRVAATPVDPRRYVQPPQVDSLDESPLNRISGWALSPEQKLLEVSPLPAGQGTQRLRLAVLPDYDGVTWRVGATYRNAGRVLPPQPLLPDADVTEVHEAITVDGLTGRLLPVVPTPTSVEGARVAYDAGSGTLIRPESLTPGLKYSVTSQVQTPDTNLLPTADSPSGEPVARFLKVGAGVPAPIQRLAEQLADGNGAAFDRATAIEEFLAEHYRKVADAPSGHAYPNLAFFLFGPRDQGGQRGTSEQFAASFALLARLTGLPSRVVVGFTVPKGGGTVTAGDAIAWPEVLFDDLGWVPFDPMPKSKDPRPVEEDFTPKPSSPPPPPSDAPPPSDEPSRSAPPVLAARPEAGPPAALVAGGASGSVVLVLVAAAFAVVLARRAQRRRRLGVGGPDDRITGAWQEFTDALRLDGRPVPHHLAATEAAAFAATESPPRRLRIAAPAMGRLARRDPAQTGPAQTGPTQGGPAQTGPTQGGPAQTGPTQGGPAQTGPTQGGPAQTGPAQGGPAQAGQAQGGPARDGPPREDGRPANEPRPLPPLDELVAGINTTGFAPGAADEDQARRAGEQAVAYAEELRQRRSWWRRAWWSIHPGPLRWHRKR